jgi:hypothetical protein
VNQQSLTDAATVEANKRLAVRWLELVSAGEVDELCRMTDASWTMVGGPTRSGPRQVGAGDSRSLLVAVTWAAPPRSGSPRPEGTPADGTAGAGAPALSSPAPSFARHHSRAIIPAPSAPRAVISSGPAEQVRQGEAVQVEQVQNRDEVVGGAV